LRCLVDTNIFLEILLGQKHQQAAKELLSSGSTHQMYITDFSLHSVGLILFREKRYGLFREFVADMLINAGIGTVSISNRRISDVVTAAHQYGLDFDDAYKYTAAKQHGLVIISFDTDFDQTDLGRKQPADVL